MVMCSCLHQQVILCEIIMTMGPCPVSNLGPVLRTARFPFSPVSTMRKDGARERRKEETMLEGNISVIR